MIKVSDVVEIVNERGLHARASAKFVGMVAELPDDLEVCVSKDGAEAAEQFFALKRAVARQGLNMIVAHSEWQSVAFFEVKLTTDVFRNARNMIRMDGMAFFVFFS